MKDRIKELKEQAFDAVWNLDKTPIGPGTHFCPDGFEQKFAELIVAECAIHMDEYADRTGKDLLEHFGVEE